MRLNKKGFTLIELLAVVIILLAVSVIAVSSISAAIERNKVKQDNAKKEVLISYAKLYFEENKNAMMDKYTTKGYVCISLDVLAASTSEIIDADGNEFTGKIKYANGSFTYVNSCS